MLGNLFNDQRHYSSVFYQDQVKISKTVVTRPRKRHPRQHKAPANDQRRAVGEMSRAFRLGRSCCEMLGGVYDVFVSGIGLAAS